MKWDAVLVPVAWTDGLTIRPLNRAACQLLDSEEAQAAGLFTADSHETWQRTLARSGRATTQLWVDLQTNDRPSGARSLRVGVSPDESGDFIITLLDQTQQQQAATQGERSSRFLRELLDQTSTVFAVVDQAGQVVFRNHAFVMLAEKEVPILSAGTVPQFGSDFHESLAELFRDDSAQQVRITTTNSGGPSRQFQINLHPLRDTVGRVHQALIIGVDLTALLEAHAEQRRLQGALERARRLEALGQMAGTIAHDFNNFLTVLQASSELLRELIPLGEMDVDESLEAIDEVTTQARSLIQDLVAFSRAQVHSVRTSTVGAVIAATRAALRRLVPTEVQFSLTLPVPTTASEDHVPLSEAQCLQIAVNLVQNAVEATAGVGRIDVSLLVIEDCLVLEVADDGPGVPVGLRTRILEPFFTTRSESGGTGLGLSSSRTLIERVNGKLEISDSKLGGAHFSVWLPLRSPDLP